VLGILVLAIGLGALVGALTTVVTKRYAIALALTDRRLLWVPWNGKTATRPADAVNLSEVRVSATRSGLLGTTLTLRWGEGAERHVTVARLWREEADEIARALSTG